MKAGQLARISLDVEEYLRAVQKPRPVLPPAGRVKPTAHRQQVDTAAAQTFEEPLAARDVKVAKEKGVYIT
jgi:hypothetical protein